MRLRITGGEFGSRLINGAATLRPGTDKVRKAIFDILGEVIVGASFVDLFAGSGAVGIEALSRGAARAIFVEKDLAHYNLIKKNLDSLGIASDQAAVRLMTVEDFVQANATPYDIVFADPWYDDALGVVGWEDLLKPSGILIIEHRDNTTPPENPQLRVINHKRYGDTAITFYSRA
ncbi:MAG: 16S rRNA (guanine(966)-N(2))-methyltransferase RsmD [bacterium]